MKLNLPVRMDLDFAGVMVEYGDVGLFVHAAQGHKGLCVHKKDAADGFVGKCLIIRKGKFVRVTPQESFAITVDLARQQRDCFRAQQMRPEHRGETVEVSLFVRQNQVHLIAYNPSVQSPYQAAWFSGL